MRPNFSFISERSMRSRRLRSTAFSMPEYACTTYQRLFAVGAEVSGVTVSWLTSFAPSALPAEDEVVQQPLERLVGEPQEKRHDDDEGEHVAGHLQGFLARRPDDLAYLARRVVAVGDQLLARLRGEESRHGEDQQPDQRDDAQPHVLLPEHVEGDDRADDEQAGDGQLGLVDAGRNRLDGRRCRVCHGSRACRMSLVQAASPESSSSTPCRWQGRRASNPQPLVLETSAL